MENHILDVWVENRSLDPVAAEVLVVVKPHHVVPSTELRGRFMGPGCPYASTVEIAYPLLPSRRPESAPPGTLSARVAIPEASLWHPQTPFLYRGSIELWQDGTRCDGATIAHGLRQISLTPRGLRINGAALAVHALELQPAPDDIAKLRTGGFNCLVIPQQGLDDMSIWNDADRLGMLLIGRVRASEAARQRALQLSGQPSCLGWLPDDTERWPAQAGLVGADMSRSARIPAGVRFLIGTSEQLTTLEDSGLPFLLAESSPAGILRGFQSKI